MLVQSIKHGRLVFSNLIQNPWIVIDTETEPKFPWKGKKDAVAYGRQQITIFAVCYRGVSYSFPTYHLSPKYPTPRDWFKLLKPLVVKNNQVQIIPVFSNANYDINV